MYEINAVFNTEHLKNVIEELIEKDIFGITILQAYPKGFFNCKEKIKEEKDDNEKVKIEIVVSDKKSKEIVMEIIRTECQDLGHGAGKMWVIKVEEVERIRTGEKNKDALNYSKKRKQIKEYKEDIYIDQIVS